MPTPRLTCLITGASSGIGRDLATIAAADNFDLVLVARRGTALRDVAAECERRHGVKVTIIPADLGDPTAARILCAEVRARGIEVHTLINNAGVGAGGTVADLPLEAQLNIIQVNITALTELTRRLLPAMIQRGTGAILNVASTAAFLPGPNMAVYYASKAYVLSFTDALGEELRGTSIHVSALCPGPTTTEFASTAGISAVKIFRQRGIVMPSYTVARIGWEGLLSNTRVVIAGLQNRLLRQSLRIVPRALVARLSASLNAS